MRRHRPIITVEYQGVVMRLSDLAKKVGIKPETMACRYHKGDRGPALWRPLCVRGRPTCPEKEDLEKQRQFRDISIQRQMKRQMEVAERTKQLRELREKRRAESAQLAAPLIAAELLTDEERREIRERVMFSGQRAWSIKGGIF